MFDYGPVEHKSPLPVCKQIAQDEGNSCSEGTLSDDSVTPVRPSVCLSVLSKRFSSMGSQGSRCLSQEVQGGRCIQCYVSLLDLAAPQLRVIKVLETPSKCGRGQTGRSHFRRADTASPRPPIKGCPGVTSGHGYDCST